MSNRHEAEPEVRRHGPGVAVAVLLTGFGAGTLFEAYRRADELSGPIGFILGAIGALFVISGVHKVFEDFRRALRDEKGKLIPTSRRQPPRDKNGFIDHDSEGLG